MGDVNVVLDKLLDIQDSTHVSRTNIQASRAKYPSIQYQVTSNIYISTVVMGEPLPFPSRSILSNIN